jgi:ubiquinone/menaquinone biosynthesis C-methylase UbiE
MDEEKMKSIAQQLRKPQGEFATRVGEMMNEGNLHMNQYAIEALHVRENDRILEIGMGNGFFVKEIVTAAPGVRYVGCDFSEAMIKEAGERNAALVESGQAGFFLANADQLPLKNETFDKIFTVNTLYFWEDPVVTLAEFARVLQPDGELLIVIRPKSVMENYPFTKYGFNMFSMEEVVALLTANAFTVTEVIEKKEPVVEIDGQQMQAETLIVRAKK